MGRREDAQVTALLSILGERALAFAAKVAVKMAYRWHATTAHELSEQYKREIEDAKRKAIIDAGSSGSVDGGV